MHKIKKNTIIQDYRYGGLKMIDNQEFICALKSSWIKRLLHSDAKWTKLIEIIFKIDMRDLWKKGLDFISNLSLNTTNIFLERGSSKLDKSY